MGPPPPPSLVDMRQLGRHLAARNPAATAIGYCSAGVEPYLLSYGGEIAEAALSLLSIYQNSLRFVLEHNCGAIINSVRIHTKSLCVATE